MRQPLSSRLARLRERRHPTVATPFEHEMSQIVAGAHVDSPTYQRWLIELGHAGNGYHRKVWEWCYIMQMLEVTGALRAGNIAAGFGVGREPIVAALAARGLLVLATDQPSVNAGAWSDTGQHADDFVAVLNTSVCPDETVRERVTFRPVDMTTVPADLGEFDALWSSCCFEHLGSRDAGFDFVVSSMKHVKPGGVAVHTTEVLADGGGGFESGALANGDYVYFYSIDDLRQLVTSLRDAGYDVRANFHVSSTHPAERAVDTQPYSHDPHLRLAVGDRVATSFGLLIRRPA